MVPTRKDQNVKSTYVMSHLDQEIRMWDLDSCALECYEDKLPFYSPFCMTTIRAWLSHSPSVSKFSRATSHAQDILLPFDYPTASHLTYLGHFKEDREMEVKNSKEAPALPTCASAEPAFTDLSCLTRSVRLRRVSYLLLIPTTGTGWESNDTSVQERLP